MNAAVPPPTYSIHEGNALLDRSSVLAIWDGSLGQAERMRAKYDWFYLHAPGGPPLMQLLRHEPDERWVGTCAAGRRRMLWRGREIQAGVLVDLAVSAAHDTHDAQALLAVEGGRMRLEEALLLPPGA